VLSERHTFVLSNTRELNRVPKYKMSTLYTNYWWSVLHSFSLTLMTMCLPWGQHMLTMPYIISQTLKHVWNMFDFNMTSNSRGYLALFVPKTPSVVWYFIMDLILPKVCGYFALFESKSTVIFICIHCPIISFKLCKFTQTLCGVFPSPNLNSYVVFH